MKPKVSNCFDLALPIGTSLILSTVTLLLFPGIATVGCQFLVGLVLIGIFAWKKVLRYARERRTDRMNESMTSRRMVDRGDVLVLIAFAAFYAAVSGSLMRAGWSGEAVRSCALFLLLSILLLKPRVAARLKTRAKHCTPLPQPVSMSPATSQNAHYPEIVDKERIQ